MYARVEMLLGIISLTVGLLALMVVFPESWWTDRRFSMPRRWEFSREVMLVGLDERYAERYGYGPTSPGYLASVVRASLAFNPSAIALDFRLGEPEAAETGMDSLAAAVREAHERGVPVLIPTVLATWQGNTVVARVPPAGLAGRVMMGFVEWDMLPAPRDFPLARQVGEGCYVLSLPAAAVAAHRRRVTPAAPACLGPGTVTEAALQRVLRDLGRSPDPRRHVPLYFAGPVHQTREMVFQSSEHILQDAAGRAIPAGMEGKLVLIAALYPHPEGEDEIGTPFGPERGGLFHLYAIDTLLRRDPLPRYVGRPGTILLAVLMFAGVFAVWRRGPAQGWVVSVITLVSYIALGFLLFPLSGLMLPIAAPLCAGLFATALGFIVYGEEGEPAQEPPASASAPPPVPPAGVDAVPKPAAPAPFRASRRLRRSGLLLMLTRTRRRS
ncbi:MAG TPA: CHASE2 domain-containing protein [Longimicrobium sp.]|nr:CHASE2 domain-containing protein [Longimicrobium sp.]